MITLIRNLHAAVRSLRRSPGFALTAALVLALGIGLSTAVFTVADALLLRRLPVRDQDRIVLLWGEKRDGSFANFPLGLDDAREFARQSRALQSVASFDYHGALANAVRDGDHIVRLRRALVSGNYFDVLGSQPVLGRAFSADDNVAGAAPLAVLSYSAWQRLYGGDTAVLGRKLLLHASGMSYTIAGVMPQGLDYPRGVDFWTPRLSSMPQSALRYAAANVIGRLADGATPADARAEMTQWFEQPGRASLRDLRGVVHTLPRIVVGDTRPAVLAFAAAAALLLLITCINVANLLIVRGLARAREIAVRSALGADRWRIVSELLTENTLLAVVGGALGVALAAGALRVFIALAPASVPRLDEMQLNAAALGAAVAITAAAMLIFAVAPALATSRAGAQHVLRSGTGQRTTRRTWRTTEWLVAGQIALAFVVLSAAGVLAKSLVRLQTTELAFDPSRLLIAELALSTDRYQELGTQRRLLEELVPRLLAIPAVRAVTPVVAAPFSGTSGWDGRPSKEGQSDVEAAMNPVVNLEVVTPDYFDTFGIPVLEGRGLTDQDRAGSQRVIVVSQSAAKQYWPGENPIGRRLVMGAGPDRTFTVVGVVPDTRYRDLRVARASIYYPLRQSFFPFAPTSLVLRTSIPPANVVPAIRHVLSQEFPGVVLANAAPFDDFLSEPLAQPRMNAFLLAVFAGASVTLAAIGLFGVMMMMVRQRTHELGIRMALGATAADVRRMVLRRGLAIATIGIAAGLTGALSANRLLVAMLYEVSPTDGPTFAALVGVVLGVAMLATFIPACSSTRVDPMRVLRSDA